MGWLLWALLSAVFAALTAVLAKIGVRGVDSNLATAVRTTIILFITWGIALATGSHGHLRTLSSRNWTFLVLSGAATGLSWLCYFRALQIGEASRVAPVDKLSVVFVLLFAWLALGESMSWLKVGGGLLITGGAILLAFA